MNALFKLRPGLFGLLLGAIAISSFSHAVTRPPRPTGAPVMESSVQRDRPTEEPSEPLPEPETDLEYEPETDLEYEPDVLTYLQYQIDVDLTNLEQTIRNRATDHIDQGRSQADLNNLLYALGKDWRATPEQLVQRLAINRALQTITDGEPAPTRDAIVNPSVEDYRNVKSAE